jgi:hypothetical protein
MQDRKKLRTGVDDQPQPQDVGMAAQPRPQLIQRERGKLELTENVFVQGLGMLAGAGQPGGDGRLPRALRPVRPPMGPALRPSQRALVRSAEREFSDGITACHVEP